MWMVTVKQAAMMSAMRLFDYPASANCFKARLLLAQLGLAYVREPVDIFAGESTTSAYRAKNPAGRTPVLELDSGETIAESNAILLYLGDGTAFVPDGLVGRAGVWQWLFFEQNLFEPNVGTARFWRIEADEPDIGRRVIDADCVAIDYANIIRSDWAGPRDACR
jgi:glutathione S-transferase